MISRPRIALLFGTLLVASACTSGSDSVEETTTTTVAVTATSVATTVATTTTSTTAAAATDNESLVADAHTRFLTEVFAVDERTDGVESTLDLVRQLTTGAQLTRMEQSAADRIASGEALVGPGYDSHIVSIEVAGDRATVVDCSQDRTALFDAAGVETIAADDFYKLRETRLINVDGTWLIEEFITGGDSRCDPADG